MVLLDWSNPRSLILGPIDDSWSQDFWIKWWRTNGGTLQHCTVDCTWTIGNENIHHTDHICRLEACRRIYNLIPVKFVSFHFECYSSDLCTFNGFSGSSCPVICESIRNQQSNFPGWPEAKSGDLQSCKTSFFSLKTADCTKNSLVLSVNIRTQVKSCSESDSGARPFYVPS